MSKIFIYIFIMAIVTYIPRAVPIVLMKKEIKSRFIKSFLYYVPFAVLGAMTFPAILYSTGNIYTGMIGAIVAVTLAYFNKGLLGVAVVSVIVAYGLGFFI